MEPINFDDFDPTAFLVEGSDCEYLVSGRTVIADTEEMTIAILGKLSTDEIEEITGDGEVCSHRKIKKGFILTINEDDDFDAILAETLFYFTM
jgi:hypothetical protein